MKFGSLVKDSTFFEHHVQSAYALFHHRSLVLSVFFLEQQKHMHYRASRQQISTRLHVPGLCQTTYSGRGRSVKMCVCVRGIEGRFLTGVTLVM